LEFHAEADGGGLLLLEAGSGEAQSIKFGPHEFLMLRSLDGKRSLKEIHAELVRLPGLEALRVENIERQVDWLYEMNLLELEEIRLADSPVLIRQDEEAQAGLTGDSEPGNSERSVGQRIFAGLAQAACVAVLVWASDQALEWQKVNFADKQVDRAELEAGSTASSPVDRAGGALAPEFDGILSELYVRDGDKVYEGEILASIDNLEIRQVLTELRSALAECQDLRDEAYAEHDWREYRLQVLHMAEITQRMGQLRFQQEVTQLRAPHAGVIRADSNLSDKVGKVVTSGQLLMSVEKVGSDKDLPYLVTSLVTQ